jgi:hypothetical protein
MQNSLKKKQSVVYHQHFVSIRVKDFINIFNNLGAHQGHKK